MALWQFKFRLISASSVCAHGVQALRINRAQADGPNLHIAAIDREGFFKALAQLLPEKNAWHSDLRAWGDEAANDVQVWFNGDLIEALDVRLDMRSLSLALVDGLCAIARNYGCVFVVTDGAVIPPTRNALMRAAERSAAASFVRDPTAFLAMPIPPDVEPD